MQKRLLFIALISFLPCESFAGAWTLPKGRLWLKSAIMYHTTDRRFCTEQDALSLAFRAAGCTAAGKSGPFDPFVGGHSQALAVFTEVVYGTTGWLDVGAQIPFYSLKFTNLANPTRPRSNSFGDIRFFARLRVLQQPIVASLKVAVKSPSGKFKEDAEAVNVSEGQWDFEFLSEVSKSFWPWRGYAGVEVGYRIRTDNEKFEYTMADEVTVLAEVGYEPISGVTIKGAGDWLRGQQPRLKVNHATLLERRTLLTLTPSVNYTPREGLNLEAGVRFTVSGQDFPDGPQLMGAISYKFSFI